MFLAFPALPEAVAVDGRHSGRLDDDDGPLPRRWCRGASHRVAGESRSVCVLLILGLVFEGDGDLYSCNLIASVQADAVASQARCHALRGAPFS